MKKEGRPGEYDFGLPLATFPLFFQNVLLELVEREVTTAGFL